MGRVLGYDSQECRDAEEVPREIVKTSTAGDNGWLIRFFDSAFFCEWIAVTYLFKHEHSGVRDYLCNRMYTLPLAGIESYLFQLCFMLVHRSSPSLTKFIFHICSRSLRVALKLHWFLLAEAEEAGDSEELITLQEKCQQAALMADWPPLTRPKKTETSLGSKNRVFKLFFPQRLFNLTSLLPSQKPISCIAAAASLVGDEAKGLSEESGSSLRVLKKLIPGPKIHHKLLKKFWDREDEESEPPEAIQQEVQQQPKRTGSEGFLRRLPKWMDVDDKVVCSDESAKSEHFFQRLFLGRMDIDAKVEGVKIDEKDGLFHRLFSDKADGRNKEDTCAKARENGTETTGENEGSVSLLFRRICRIYQVNTEEKGGAEIDEEDGFVRRLFCNKAGCDMGGVCPKLKDGERGTTDGKEYSEFFFLRRLRRIHPESEQQLCLSNPEAPTVSTSENSLDMDGFLKRLFHGRKLDAKRSILCEGGSDQTSSIKKLLTKDCTDEGAVTLSENAVNVAAISSELPQEVKSSTRNFFYDVARLHMKGRPAKLGENFGVENRPTSTIATEKCSHECLAEVEQVALGPISYRTTRSPLTTLSEDARQYTNHVGRTKQRIEKADAKLCTPMYSLSQLGKGPYHATLDFVQLLCKTSSSLINYFPVEDRWRCLHESLVELNAILANLQKNGGVCFPLGKGLFQVVHIPEHEGTLLNSREKAPYLICLEVLNCDEQSKGNIDSDTQTPSCGGIPLANGDVHLQRLFNWTYPLGNQANSQQSNTKNLREASQVIDGAMHQSWEANVNSVHVTLSITQRCVDLFDSPTDQTERSDKAMLNSRCEEKTENGHDQPGANGKANSMELLQKFRHANSLTDTEGHGHRLDEYRDLAQISTKREVSSSEAGTATGWKTGTNAELPWEREWVSVMLTAMPGLNMQDEEEHVARLKDVHRVPSNAAMVLAKDSGHSEKKTIDALAGELWEHKKNRIRASSKFGHLPGWNLRSVIVKTGDDCRQEHLAVQLISCFHDIFQEVGLPLWLRPYEVLVTSSCTALIETIPDTASIHAIKSRNSNISTLRDFFCHKYEENSLAFKQAQRNFVESMAAYSILCYFLQVKDRHNGNLLLDEEGHIIHIDFGFMLSNTPGGVNFESAPFKLTRELLEVMDSDAEGRSSEFFDYFKVLFIQGFLTCRKHAERVVFLVEMMQDYEFPCFKGGLKTVQNLRRRFHLALTEEQCVSLVLSLISRSLDAWRTRQYDYYQRVLNGIL